jgi:tripartite-type tricarboxylate transporter receptor subunit TctC
MAESGFPGFESYEWWALLGPAGMPKDVVDKLNAELAKIMASPDVKQRLRTIGVEYSGDTTPQQSEAYMKAEMKKWAEVAKGAGMKPE